MTLVNARCTGILEMLKLKTAVIVSIRSVYLLYEHIFTKVDLKKSVRHQLPVKPSADPGDESQPTHARRGFSRLLDYFRVHPNSPDPQHVSAINSIFIILKIIRFYGGL